MRYFIKNILIFLLWVIASFSTRAESTYLPQGYIESIYKKTETLLRFHADKSDIEKINAVNMWVNNFITYTDDTDVIKKIFSLSKDWLPPFYKERYQRNPDNFILSPLETMALGVGDCEDLALLKYFLLYKLGINEERLRLGFGRITRFQNGIQVKQSHMVLLVRDQENHENYFVLDNVDKAVKTVHERNDMVISHSIDLILLLTYESTTTSISSNIQNNNPKLFAKLFEISRRDFP